jgi:hypothetical protein
MMYFVVVNSADEINNEINEKKMNLMVGVYNLVHVIRFIPLQ